MKGVVGRRGPPAWRLLKEHWETLSNDELAARGEPFLLNQDPLVMGVPLIRLLGVGSFWRATADGFGVVGQAMDLWDPKNDDEMRMFLDERRGGIIRGRWFSRYCPDGEYGTRRLAEVDLISETVFNDALLQLRTR